MAGAMEMQGGMTLSGFPVGRRRSMDCDLHHRSCHLTIVGVTVLRKIQRSESILDALLANMVEES